ncbi:MAG TPA: STN and carboxypeptidase regulatory-like domain-containing protein [Cyclobacteriaceae bacterium]|nr:STN and carboxypeptidase regulatory-like domain-containing protein [Cyclobacteriaceae bacterium]
MTKISIGQATPPLERSITITFSNEKFDVVLSRLSQQGKFTFSYNPAIFDASRSYSGSFSNKSVREILNQLFGGTVQYKTKGNYIILTRTPAQEQKTSTEKPLIISGYVVNSETGEKVQEVSIYDKKTLTSVISNSFGYFKLKIDKPSDINSIAFNKRTFRDTLITVSKGEDQFITMLMNPEIIISVTPTENVDSMREDSVTKTEEPDERESETMKESQVNMLNIKDTLYSEFQVSFVPFVGTHHMLSGNVISDYSINILGGYTFGVRRLEVGGIFNIDRGDVQHAQVAGVFNAVNGNVKGFQGAGNVNLVRGRIDGVQMAGTMNINLGGIEGPQFAGILNINTTASRGAQFAGIMNVQVQDFKGSQFAGALNVATHHISGTQIAAVNYGRHVRGSQIGVLNLSDSIRGVPIGILSYVRSGYHKIELSADEIFYTNLAFRTGVRQFYNIFSASIKPDDFGDPFWAMGYGIGTAPRLSKWLYLNFDLQSSHVSQGHLEESLSLLNKAYLGFDIQVTRRFSITAGATLNGYLTDRGEEYPSLFTDNTPHVIYDEDVGDKSHLQMWWGWKVGLRFL